MKPSSGSGCILKSADCGSHVIHCSHNRENCFQSQCHVNGRSYDGGLGRRCSVHVRGCGIRFRCSGRIRVAMSTVTVLWRSRCVAVFRCSGLIHVAMSTVTVLWRSWCVAASIIRGLPVPAIRNALPVTTCVCSLVCLVTYKQLISSRIAFVFSYHVCQSAKVGNRISLFSGHVIFDVHATVCFA